MKTDETDENSSLGSIPRVSDLKSLELGLTMFVPHVADTVGPVVRTAGVVEPAQTPYAKVGIPSLSCWGYWLRRAPSGPFAGVSPSANEKHLVLEVTHPL